MAVNQTLTLTETKVNNDANTSQVRILWQSTQSGSSWNGYTRVAKYYISINGGAETEYSVNYTLPQSTTKTIVDATITVAHKSDGSGTVKVRTWMDTSISAGEIEQSDTINLTTIPRASTISYVSNVILGNLCTVRWTPLSKTFWYKMKFSVGEWSLTTAAIHPNTTTLYTNSSYGISVDAAHQFPNSKDAEMTVTLYTYSDEACTKQVGTASTAKCRVNIPENEDTLPAVRVRLTPVNLLSEDFDGLYIQGKTKVQVSYEDSEAKYSATIKSYSTSVNGKVQYDPNLSDYLSTAGTVSVKCTAEDSRGLSASTTPEITVIPYSKPSIIPFDGERSIICKRCDSTGKITPTGTYLKIKAGRQYSKVLSGDTQKNFCLMQLQYRAEGDTTWNSWTTILSKDDLSDSIDTTLTSINLPISTTYLVRIEVVDDLGESSSMIITIPTADVTVHLREGGKALGVGKYAEKDYIVDIDDAWEVNARGDLKVGGTFYPSHIASIDNYANRDFNELIYKTGYYTGSAEPLHVYCSNYPVNKTGLLEVISAMLQNETSLVWWGFAYQTYRTYTGEVYMRSYFSSSGWTAWKQVTLT